MIKEFFKLFLLIFILFLSACETVTESDDTGYPIGLPDYSEVDSDASWSHDGKYIAYFHDDSVLSKTGLYLIDSAGNENRFLVNGRIMSPDWSPDDKCIVFGDFYDYQIYKINLEEKEVTRLTNGGANFFPSYSTDGKYIVFDNYPFDEDTLNQIIRINSDGSDRKTIAFDLENGAVRSPSYSINKDIIVHSRSGNFEGPGPEIFTMAGDGSNLKRITYLYGIESYPRFSPDDKEILFTRTHTDDTNSPLSYTCIIGSDGKNLRNLTYFLSSNGDWSPDGKKIVLTDMRFGHGNLIIVNRKGEIIKEITPRLVEN